MAPDPEQHRGIRERPKPRPFGARLAAFAAGAVLLFGFTALSIVQRHGVDVRPGWTARANSGAMLVYAVDPSGPATVLRPGDRVLSVDGDTTAAVYGPRMMLARLGNARDYTVEVARNGSRLSFRLSLPQAPAADISQVWLAIFVALLLFAIGAWIDIAGARDRTARLATAAYVFSAFAMLASAQTLFPGWGPATAGIATVLAVFWRPLHLPIGLHFITNFPQPVRQPLPARAALVAVYITAGVLWLAINFTVAAELAGVRPGPIIAALMTFRAQGRVGTLLTAGLESVAGALMCFQLIRNYFELPDATSRRRIRWAGLALGVPIADYVLVSLTRFLFYMTGQAFWDALTKVGNNVAPFVVGFSPLAMGYAVVKHRVLGIRIALRRGIQYLLARQVLQAVLFLPVILIFFHAISNPDRTLGDLVFRTSWPFYVALAITSALSLRFRRPMRVWLDQKFFRTVLNQEDMLSALIERIKAAESRDEICITVAREIELALHVEALHILLRDDPRRPLDVAYSRTPDRAKQARDYLNSIARAARGLDSVVTLYETNDANLAVGPGPLPWRENLAVAISGTDGANIGVLVLGPKRSEEPYTRAERDLFRAICGQVGVMFEILALRSHVQDARRQQMQMLARVEGKDVPLVRECPDCGACYGPPEQVCRKDGARLALTVPVERVIDEKYRLDRRIGQGAMGVVYEALDQRLNRAVAVKVLASDLFGNRNALARFAREARAAALLDHTNIVRVHDFGTLPGGAAYVVMELIRGVSWRAYLANGPMPPGLAAECIAQLSSAVETAHRAGIIHRDLKPENLMMADDGTSTRVVVLDFGVAKMWADLHDRSMTLAGAPVGTLGYMSPEQRTGALLDHRTDIYSLAVICAEILSGVRPPVTGASAAWLSSALSARTQGDELIHLLTSAIDEQPSRRPSSAALFGDRSERLIRNSVLALPGGAGSLDSADTSTMRGATASDS